MELRFWGEIGGNDSFKRVKGDRDFVQNLPEIEWKEGKWVVGEVEVEEEEVEECLKKQGNRKAAGEDEIGGKVWKEIWEKEKGREVITGFRSALGVVMRKLRKEDYGKLESYRGEKREEQYGRGGRTV
ncbi:hypothetical protein C7212DRAFT_326936 [Tuber magnatum]|uniref:Uncharacterized protein n=1 Tax=Tuber magnatum TaxID=42249 RepID=A0A317SJ91_9PEZI|nr:hypothetical protein C7212DRAFT_326936 [Tuber magnatum]